MLDRRSSIGIGVPFVLQDCDIDSTLPAPIMESCSDQISTTGGSDAEHARAASNQYLSAMIGFTRLSGKVCRLMNTLSDKNLEFPRDEIEYLDYQALQWRKNLPRNLQFSEVEIKQGQADWSASAVPLFLGVVLSVRSNQIRNLIYRPVLYSASRISSNPTHAQTAVDITKQSVQLLWSLSQSTSFLRSHPVFFKHFLVSTFATLLLAIVNAWSEFGLQVRNEFYMTLDLLKSLSSESPLVMRYWKTIKGLEELAQKLGLSRAQNNAWETQIQSNRDGNNWNLSEITNVAPSVVPPADLLNTSNAADAADVRNEFATFLDSSTGYLSLFDFPLTEMFDTNLSDNF